MKNVYRGLALAVAALACICRPRPSPTACPGLVKWIEEGGTLDASTRGPERRVGGVSASCCTRIGGTFVVPLASPCCS